MLDLQCPSTTKAVTLATLNHMYLKRNPQARLPLLLSSIALGLAAHPAMAQVFSDNFTTDSSLGSEWFNMYNTSAASMVLNPTAGQGLALNVSSGTGKTDEAFAQFAPTPVTLGTVGDSVTLTVDFNSADLSGNSGTATGGLTATHQGYFGIMGFNTSAGTSTKFYTRQGGASDANELGYYSSMTSGSYSQLSAFAASGNGTLANSTAYVLTYTVTKGTGIDTITAVIDQGNTAVDSWTTTDSSGTYNTFDELDFGAYGKNALVDVNVTDVQVTDSIAAAVPEPGSFGMAGAGLMAVIFRRRLFKV